MSEWNKHVKRTFKIGLANDPTYSLKMAMKQASKSWKKTRKSLGGSETASSETEDAVEPQSAAAVADDAPAKKDNPVSAPESSPKVAAELPGKTEDAASEGTAATDTSPPSSNASSVGGAKAKTKAKVSTKKAKPNKNKSTRRASSRSRGHRAKR